MMVETNQGHNSSYISMAVYRYNSTFALKSIITLSGISKHKSWEKCTDSYRATREMDPDYINNNYRLKAGVPHSLC